MSLVDRALRLWAGPLPEGEAALAAFRSVYTDPVEVNGSLTALQVLVERARMMQGAFGDMTHQIKEHFTAPGRHAFAFSITGRHVGPLDTPYGQIEPTGRELLLHGMDIFLVDEDADRVTGVWAIADYLQLLMDAGVLQRHTASER